MCPTKQRRPRIEWTATEFQTGSIEKALTVKTNGRSHFSLFVFITGEQRYRKDVSVKNPKIGCARVYLEIL